MKSITRYTIVAMLLATNAFAQGRHDPRSLFMWLDWDALHRIRLSHCTRIASSEISKLDAEYAKWRQENQPALESLYAITREQLKREGKSNADVESAIQSMKKETTEPYLAIFAEGPADPEERKRWEAQMNKSCTPGGYSAELAQFDFVEFLSQVQARMRR